MRARAVQDGFRPRDPTDGDGTCDLCGYGEIAAIAVRPDEQVVADVGFGGGAAVDSKIIAMSKQAEPDKRYLLCHQRGLFRRMHPHRDIDLLVEQVGAGLLSSNSTVSCGCLSRRLRSMGGRTSIPTNSETLSLTRPAAIAESAEAARIMASEACAIARAGAAIASAVGVGTSPCTDRVNSVVPSAASSPLMRARTVG